MKLKPIRNIQLNQYRNRMRRRQKLQNIYWKHRKTIIPTTIVLGVLFLSLVVYIITKVTGCTALVGGVSLDAFISFCMIGLVLVGMLVYYFFNREKYQTNVGYSLLACSPIFSFFITQILNNKGIFDIYYSYLLMNLILYALLYLFFFAISNRIRICIICASSIWLVFSLADYFVMQFRGTPFLPWDILAISTAVKVVSGYQFHLTFPLFAAILVYLLLIANCLTLQEYPTKKHLRFKSLRWRIPTGIGSVLLFITLALSPLLTAMGCYSDPWQLESSRSNNSALLNFTLNLPYISIKKPKDYSPQAVREIILQAEQSYQKNSVSTNKIIQPKNIIVIMNEALSDLRIIHDFDTTKEYLLFFNSLTENTIRGNSYVSIFGGRTCNSEFEAITGNTLAFLPQGSVAFLQYVNQNINSFAKQLDHFTSYGLHPLDANSWKRSTVYPMMGFDAFLGIDEYWDLDEGEILETSRNLVTDQANYNKLIEIYKQKESNSNLLIYNITIQNHSGYSDTNYSNTVRLKNMQEDYPHTEQYLSLLRDSDEAFESLINYFSEQEEPTLILMFGDHQPKIEDEFYEELFGKPLEELTLEEKQKRYITPYILWANYDIPENTMDLSINFLPVLLMETAHFELTGYQKFLKQFYQEIPVINSNGYIDKNGNHHTFDEKNEYTQLINQYQMIQYNNLFDQKNRLSELLD